MTVLKKVYIGYLLENTVVFDFEERAWRIQKNDVIAHLQGFDFQPGQSTVEVS